jgi:transposase
MNTDYNIRIKAVKCYKKSGQLKKCAKRYNVHPFTLERWIQWYKKGGKESLNRKKAYYRAWNRIFPSVEQQIVLLKENDPSLTLSEAKSFLRKRGIKISINGIWCIWKRYNLAGFHTKNSPLVEKTETIPEIKDGIKKVDQALSKRDVKKAARILNALPSCDGQNILRKIPDRLLSLSRRVEKLDLTFGQISFRETTRKAKFLRKRAEDKGYFCLAIRAGCSELNAMSWVGRPKKMIALARTLLKRMKRKEGRDNSNTTLRFNLLVLKGIALGTLGKVGAALVCIRKCETLCRNSSSSSYYRDIASLYSIIGSFKKSHYWLLKALEYSKTEDKTILYGLLAGTLAKSGAYRDAKKILKRVHIEKRGFETLVVMIKAQCLIGEGKIQEAVKLANIALQQSKRETIRNYFATSSMVLSCCLCALGDEKKAKKLMRRILPVLKKFRMEYDLLLPRVLLGQDIPPKDTKLSPSLKLALQLSKASHSLKIKNYRKAFNYATSQQLMGLLHRLVLFFPEPVNKLIAKGKPTGLPKALLNLPVFQKNIPVYHLMFLGPVRVYRNGIRLRNDPTPIYASFIIHLGFKKRIELNSLYRNFWPHAKDPRGSLSHLLYGIRKYLRLLPGTLFIKQGFLHFKGYITTDYQFYEETMIRAKALEQAGEWGFAKKEYLRTFKLFRGEPFRKMYDPWSEHMRRVILNKLETEVMHFTKSCLEHKKPKDAQKVLNTVSKIIPIHPLDKFWVSFIMTDWSVIINFSRNKESKYI